MAKSLGVETPKQFFAGWGIGDEIQQTITFLTKLFVKFIKMIHVIYKTLKKYILKYVFKIWPIYLSFFIVAMVITLFNDKAKRKRNMLFLVYLGLVYITFLIFLFIIRVVEYLINCFIFLIKEFKNINTFIKKKKYGDAVLHSFFCIFIIIWIFLIILFIFGLCFLIKNFSYFNSAIFDLIESMDDF
jgi:hypothetical protein